MSWETIFIEPTAGIFERMAVLRVKGIGDSYYSTNLSVSEQESKFG